VAIFSLSKKREEVKYEYPLLPTLSQNHNLFQIFPKRGLSMFQRLLKRKHEEKQIKGARQKVKELRKF